MTIEQQCAAALERLRSFINRSAGQHMRAMRETFKTKPESIK